MEIKSLGKTNFETITKACIQAFADYEIQLRGGQFAYRRKDSVLIVSVGCLKN